jgi:hypothetical protein
MRMLMSLTLGLALVLGWGSTSWAGFFHHHKNPAHAAMKDVKKARKAAAKQDRPKHFKHKHKHH